MSWVSGQLVPPGQGLRHLWVSEARAHVAARLLRDLRIVRITHRGKDRRRRVLTPRPPGQWKAT